MYVKFTLPNLNKTEQSFNCFRYTIYRQRCLDESPLIANNNEINDNRTLTHITTLIASFMGPTWGPPGSCRPRWAPCWPHEPCYLEILNIQTLQRQSYFRAQRITLIAKHYISVLQLWLNTMEFVLCPDLVYSYKLLVLWNFMFTTVGS